MKHIGIGQVRDKMTIIVFVIIIEYDKTLGNTYSNPELIRRLISDTVKEGRFFQFIYKENSFEYIVIYRHKQ